MIRAHIDIDKVYVTDVIISTTRRRGAGTPSDPIRVITEVFTRTGELIAEYDPSCNVPEGPSITFWRNPSESLPLPAEGSKWSVPVIIETTSGAITKARYSYVHGRWAGDWDVVRWRFIPE